MAGGYRVTISLSVIALSGIVITDMNVCDSTFHFYDLATLRSRSTKCYAKSWSESDHHKEIWILGYFDLSIAYLILSALAFSYCYARTSILASEPIHEKGLLVSSNNCL